MSSGWSPAAVVFLRFLSSWDSYSESGQAFGKTQGTGPLTCPVGEDASVLGTDGPQGCAFIRASRRSCQQHLPRKSPCCRQGPCLRAGSWQRALVPQKRASQRAAQSRGHPHDIRNDTLPTRTCSALQICPTRLIAQMGRLRPHGLVAMLARMLLLASDLSCVPEGRRCRAVGGLAPSGPWQPLPYPPPKP